MKEEIRQKYSQYKAIEEHVSSLAAQAEEVRGKLVEIEYLLQSLDSLKGVSEGTPILAPLSSGIFLRAFAGNTDRLLVNVGMGTVVEKSVEDTKSLLKGQRKGLEELRQAVAAELSEYSRASEALEKELRGMIKNV